LRIGETTITGDHSPRGMGAEMLRLVAEEIGRITGEQPRL
jgi:hypothetical protein